MQTKQITFPLMIGALKIPENLLTVKLTCSSEQEIKFRKPILPASSIRGKLRSAIEKFTNFQEDNKDYALTNLPIQSGKTYCFNWTIASFTKSLKYFFDNIYYDKNCLISHNRFKKSYYIPGNKTEELKQINSLKLSLFAHDHARNTYSNGSIITIKYLLFSSICIYLCKVYRKTKFIVLRSTTFGTKDNIIQYTNTKYFSVEYLLNYNKDKLIYKMLFYYVFNISSSFTKKMIEKICKSKVKLIIKNVLFYLLKIQYLSIKSVIIYVVNKMKLKFKLFYTFLDTVYHFDSIASVPP